MDIKKILQQIDKVNEGYRDYPDDDDDEVDYDRFAQKGSALHSADKNNPRDQDCPTCGEENVLTRRDVAKGYQCDTCADRAEGKIQYESKKLSLKDYFHKIDEDATSGMKPLPMLDPKKQQVGAAVITSTNPTIQKILKNLTPQDVQVIQTMTKTGQPNQSGTQTTGTNTNTSAGSMQPMKEAFLSKSVSPGL
jgi:ribosomal protein L37AE/L43A